MDNTKDGWQERLAAHVGSRVKALRNAQGKSAQDVADHCTNELGFKLLRTTLANLESGARKNVTLGEVVALAAALDVSPMVLMFPPESSETIEYLPGWSLSQWEAWQQFAAPLPEILTAGPPIYWKDDSVATSIISTIVSLEMAGTGWRIAGGTSKDSRAPEEYRELSKKEATKMARQSLSLYEELLDKGVPLSGIDQEWIAALEAARSAAGKENGERDA
ncbi:helix-turn-helix domain-containing protein [Citricoccus sp. GCM10030269]|uniref:helix-turn-helix domain-containing protein n=1 Tax=Citricoccus sp. GCM10030269 TaxID=3273388 RepID=UPI00361210A8